MLDFIAWYVLVTALGWIVFPLLFHVLSDIPGRGFTFSKIFGLMFWGYLYWILGRLGFTANNLAGLIFTLLLVIGAVFFVLQKKGIDDLRDWIQSRWRLILTTELLFLAAFAGWALIRSLNPEILGTEKPMELAFINAILYSESLPPHDPWLSGYAISYYYFGYVLVAMLAKFAGTLGSVAFNLGVSLTFGLTAVGSFGVLYNLLALRTGKKTSQLLPALLGPFFTLILSNWEGFLHYLHAKGLFWQGLPDQASSPFWNWLDIQILVDPPVGDSFGHWWWWRASRVIQDYNFSGYGREVISEFPLFSFLLGDLHPHVLSIPYVFLILGFGLALFLRPKGKSFRWLGLVPIEISPLFFLILAWLAGGMAFLNIWNFPMYVGILAGVYALRNQRERVDWQTVEIVKDFLFFGATLGLTGGVMYLPWYLGFASQAGGLIPNVLYITKGNQFWVMFGPLLVPIFAWLIAAWKKKEPTGNVASGLALTGLLVLGLFILMLLMIGMLAWFPLRADGNELLTLFLSSVGGLEIGQVLIEGLRRRVMLPGTLITLIALSILGWGLLFYKKPEGKSGIHLPQKSANNFVLVLIVAGMALVLFPEFIFLKDLFGYRINTIFKFYYQAWLLWSIAAAYGTVRLIQSLKTPWRYLIYSGLFLSMFMGLFYPVLGLQSKTNNFTREAGLTLDGAYLYPDSDYQAVEWLRNEPSGVIAEAAGESYSPTLSRLSTYTGNSTILGWDFHEIQWRGNAEIVNPRKEDLITLYCTHQWEVAKNLLEKYNVLYLAIGDAEYTKYAVGSDNCPNGLNSDKFIMHLQPVYQNERLTIFQVPPASSK
ncbi:MAG: hypothetical protein DRI65_08715 [Chloroflexota bacterium]|nr:MAG: hypothetical protein DRI65_08715 [Chloroflexota bacterium]